MAELCRLNHRDEKSGLIYLNPNPLQADLLDTLDQIKDLKARYNIDGPTRLIALKQRGGGLSSILLGMMFVDCAFNRGIQGVVIAHKDETSQLMNDYVKGFYDNWPQDNRRAPLRTFASSSGEKLNWPEIGSSIRFTTAQSLDPRGGRADIILATEMAHYKKYVAYLALMGQKKAHTLIVDESTANGPSGYFHDKYRAAWTVQEVRKAYEAGDYDAVGKWSSAGGVFKFFFPWHKDPGLTRNVHPEEALVIMRGLDQYESEMVRRFGWTVGQVKFRRETIAENKVHPSLSPEAYFAQEFPSFEDEAFQGSGSQPFNIPRLRAMEARAQDTAPISMQRIGRAWPERSLRGNANFLMWKRPLPGHDYVIGADAGFGLATGDWSVASIFDRCDGTVLEQVAEFRARIEAKMFGHLLCILGDLYNEAFLMPEVSGPGLSTCEVIIENRYSRIYHARTLGRVGGVSDNNGFNYGFATGQGMTQKKSALIEDLRESIMKGVIEIRSLRALYELKNFRNNEGVYEAPHGDFDDAVISCALGNRAQREAGPLRIGPPKGLITKPLLRGSEKRLHDAFADKIRRSESVNAELLAMETRVSKSPGSGFIGTAGRLVTIAPLGRPK